MNPRMPLFTALLTASIAAQEVHREVIPGREFRDSKVLTPGQVDLWNLDVEANEVLRCDVSAQDLDPVIDLVDADGDVLLSDDGEGSKCYLQYRAPIAGKLVIRVRGFQGAGGGRYELALERYVAPALDVGQRVDGTFGVERWAHVRLQLERGDVVVPVVHGASLTSFWLFAERRPIAARLGAYVAPEAGEYHLRLEGPHEQRWQLRTLRARRLDARDGEPVAESVEPHGLDIVRVTLPADAAMRFDLQTPGAELQRWHELLGERPRWFEHGNYGKWGLDRRVFWSPRELAVDLWLRNPHGSATAYEFAVSRADVDVPGPGEASQLPLGDVRVHRLHVEVGEILHVHVRSSAFDPGVALFDPDGQHLGSYHDRAPLDRSASATFHARRGGDYRIVVSCEANTGGGEYSLDVRRLEVPELPLARPLQVTCGPHDDANARLQLRAGQEVWLSVRSGACDAAVTIVDDRGERLGTFEGGGVGGDVLTALRRDHDTRLTLFVHSRGGSGTCVLQALAVE